MIALYLGEVDENKILEMSYPFFQGVLRELGYLFNFQSTVNLLGNSFAAESGFEAVQTANPFNAGAPVKKRKVTIGDMQALAGKVSVTNKRG